jgi:hypothetical protein
VEVRISGHERTDGERRNDDEQFEGHHFAVARCTGRPAHRRHRGHHRHTSDLNKHGQRAASLRHLPDDVSTENSVAISGRLHVTRLGPIVGPRVPRLGGVIGHQRDGLLEGKGIHMKVVRRIAIALSSLLAVALAGGAHWRG